MALYRPAPTMHAQEREGLRVLQRTGKDIDRVFCTSDLLAAEMIAARANGQRPAKSVVGSDSASRRVMRPGRPRAAGSITLPADPQ